LQTILDVVLPVFAIVACGFAAGRLGVVDKDGARSLNSFVYYVALPALLFLALARAPVDRLADWGFLAANLGGILVSFVAAILAARLLFGRHLPDSAIDGMAASYGTTGYMGLPLLIAAFGTDAALPAALATLIHNIPVIAAVTLAFEVYGASGKDETGHETKSPLPSVSLGAARAVLLNPLTVSFVAGAVVAVSGVGLPGAVGTFSGLLADAAGPTALFAIGVGLATQTIADQGAVVPTQVGTILGLKMILQPAVTAVLALLVFDLEGLWAATAIIMSALPVGAGVYVFAQRYERSVEQTSVAVLVSMVLSVAPVSALVVLAQALLLAP
jgi:predicted permease